MSDLDIQVIDLARELLFTALVLSGPILVVGLVVGVAVSLFQALTSVQEQTMSLVPKMLAVVGVVLLLLAPGLGVLQDYCIRVFERLTVFGLS